MDTLKRAMTRLGYTFKTDTWLEYALTHSTYAYEHDDKDGVIDNERLEFLGDAVLQLVVSDALFRERPRLPEGEMTKLRASIVCEATLAQAASAIDLGSVMRFGHGEEATGGADKPSNLANAMEAVFGAVYRDGGLESARRVILAQLDAYIQLALQGELIYDYKSRLFERAQDASDPFELSFDVLSEDGPDHARTFTVGVSIDGKTVAEGTGRSKKDAEQHAARLVLAQLSRRRDDS